MWRTIFLALALGACTTFPELRATVEPEAKEGRFPRLVPFDQILSAPSADVENRFEVEDEMLARIAALQARAAALRGPVLDRRTQRRMRRGVRVPRYATQ